MEDKMDLSVVIPAYNEQENVVPLYGELSKILNAITPDHEIIFVDDGSSDNTFQQLQSLHAQDKRVKVIKLRKNFGQSAAMRAGFDYASGEIIVTMDADLQNDPASIPVLLEELNSGYDVVCGWRKSRKDSFFKKVFSRISNFLRRKVTGELIHDSGCSLRAHRNGCVKELELYGEMHRYIPALLSWRGYKVGEVKVAHRPRIYGKTKYGIKRLSKGFLDLFLFPFLGIG